MQRQVFWGAFAIILGVALLRTVTSKTRLHSAYLPDGLAHDLYLETTDREAPERREAAFRFPGSLWSQEDDFFAKQAAYLKGLAGERGVSMGSLLMALDRGMRERWPTHPDVFITPKVIPCRPRLAYH